MSDPYLDTVVVTTPEGLDLQIVLAGLGSRFLARVIDSLIQGALGIALLLGLRALGASLNQTAPTRSPSSGPGPAVAAALVVAFVFLFLIAYAYDVLFETLSSGRTPGKRVAGIKVVRAGGQPVGLAASAVRNLLRLVDFLPGSYAIGVISILVSERNQRLGDMAAGTLVIRDRRLERRPSWSRSSQSAQDATISSWDVSAVTAEEIVTVRRFLERRHDLLPKARDRLSWELAQRLRPKVAGAPHEQHPETFLEQLAAAKAARG